MDKVLQLIMILLALSALSFRLRSRKYYTDYGKSLKWYKPTNWYIGYDGICKAYTPKGVKLFYYSNLCIYSFIALILLGKML